MSRKTYSVNPSNKQKNMYGRNVQTTPFLTQTEQAKNYLCSNGCTPNFYYKREKEPYSCIPLYDKNKKEKKCFTDTPYEQFYNKIDWSTLHSIIESKAVEFSIICGNDPELVDKVNQCFNPQFTISDGGLFFARQSTSNSANICNDIILSFKVPCIVGMNNHNFQLFHIALHSRMPYFNETKDRNSSSCGYSVKNANAIDCGPFHYKIDNNCLNLKDYLKKSPDKGCYTSFGVYGFDTAYSPFKKFDFNPANASFIDNANNFIIPGRNPVRIDPPCMDIHRIIYSKFVHFWNESILPDIILPGIKLPPSMSLPPISETPISEKNSSESSPILDPDESSNLKMPPPGFESPISAKGPPPPGFELIGGKKKLKKQTNKRRIKKRRTNKRRTNKRRTNKRRTNKR